MVMVPSHHSFTMMNVGEADFHALGCAPGAWKTVAKLRFAPWKGAKTAGGKRRGFGAAQPPDRRSRTKKL